MKASVRLSGKHGKQATRLRGTDVIPVAPRPTVYALERKTRACTDPLVPYIPSMTYWELDEFTWRCLLRYDAVMGRMPMQIPDTRYQVSKEHQAWEGRIMDLIFARDQALHQEWIERGGEAATRDATSEEALTMERDIRERCESLLPRIHRMTLSQLFAFIRRGLRPFEHHGPTKTIRYRFTGDHQEWEEGVVTAMVERIAVGGIADDRRKNDAPPFS